MHRSNLRAIPVETRQKDRDEILGSQPQIILTNYVMLEYLLMRQQERPLLETATRDLRNLVIDELHVYRGRQGADVAMLLRRVHEKAGRSLQVIGTSATLATGENPGPASRCDCLSSRRAFRGRCRALPSD